MRDITDVCYDILIIIIIINEEIIVAFSPRTQYTCCVSQGITQILFKKD